MSAVPKSPIACLIECLFVTAVVLIAAESTAQTFTPYATFQALPPAQLTTLQGKISCVGGSLHEVTSVGFSAAGHSFSAALFAPYYRPAFRHDYSGDLQARTFTASTSELKAMIDSVGLLPEVTAGGADSLGYVSFALMQTSGDTTRVFEAIVDTTNGRALFEKLFHAFLANQSATSVLFDAGCSLDMLDTAVPNDVTTSTTTRLRGLRVDRRTKQYVGTIRITNSSAATLQPPLILVIQADEGVDVANAEGRTCRVFPSGAAVFSLGSGLAPGSHVDVVTRFDNPDNVQIRLVVAKVLSGSGTH